MPLEIETFKEFPELDIGSIKENCMYEASWTDRRWSVDFREIGSTRKEALDNLFKRIISIYSEKIDRVVKAFNSDEIKGSNKKL